MSHPANNMGCIEGIQCLDEPVGRVSAVVRDHHLCNTSLNHAEDTKVTFGNLATESTCSHQTAGASRYPGNLGVRLLVLSAQQ